MPLSRRNFVFATATLLAVPAPVFAKNIPELNLARSGLALRGVDPTSYFTEGKPVKGSRNITTTHNGGTYRFVSEASQALFESDPEAYLPAYGGYCSYGTAVKTKVDGDPYIWHIVDGKLYLNITRSVDRVWQRDIPGYISDANKNWTWLESQ